MTKGALTIICYHYVRNMKLSRYPKIHGLDYGLFKGQLDYLLRHYEPVTAQQVVAAVRGAGNLPSNGVLLTFDDGYLDHYTYVLPELQINGVSGVFFPPVAAINERQVLDVNKIHFIVAAVEHINDVVQELCAAVERHQKEYDLLTVESYRERWAHAGRYDDADTMFVKRMLQKGLPDHVRSKFLSALFEHFVCSDERVFANELYMNMAQLRTLKACGMSIGSHGVTHRWFTNLSSSDVKAELEGSWSLLENLGERRGEAVICYPYGGYNATVVDAVRKSGFVFGVTVESRLANIGADDPMLLPRLDTNDLPKKGNAEIDDWTQKVH